MAQFDGDEETTSIESDAAAFMQRAVSQIPSPEPVNRPNTDRNSAFLQPWFESVGGDNAGDFAAYAGTLLAPAPSQTGDVSQSAPPDDAGPFRNPTAMPMDSVGRAESARPDISPTHDRAAVRASTGDWVGIIAPGHTLHNARSQMVGLEDSAHPTNSNSTLPYGLFAFEIHDVTPGGTATVQMLLPANAHPSTYFKQDSTGAMQRFDYDDTTGAVIDGNVVTLHFIDGGRGDADGLANGVIVDPGGPGNDTFHFEFSEYSVVENEYAPVITVVREGDALEAAWVDYCTSDGTATSPDDYVQASGTLYFAAGETTNIFNIAVFQDDLVEGTETVTLTLSNAIGATIVSPNPAVLNISDPVPEVHFEFGEYQQSEAGWEAAITVVRDTELGAMVSVDYATSNGTATAGSDYIAVSGTLNFASLETEKTFYVPVYADNFQESDETVTLTLSNPVGALLVDPNAATLTIIEAPPPIVYFESATYTADEDDWAATIAVHLSAPTAETVTVAYASADGTATAGLDYDAVNGTLTFLVGETVQEFAVPLYADMLVEPPETVTLTLSNAVNATIVSPNPATLTIVDALPPQVRFSASAYEAWEDNSPATVFVELSAPTSAPVTVQFATQNGSALGDIDYTATTVSVTFDPGVTSVVQEVALLNDEIWEDNETFTALLSNPTNATLGAPAVTEITLHDDDKPIVSIEATDEYAWETIDNDGTFTISRTGQTDQPLAVSFSLTGTAINGTDYAAISLLATIPANSSYVDVAVAVIDDLIAENSETVVATLLPGLYALGSPESASVTIEETEDEPETAPKLILDVDADRQLYILGQTSDDLPDGTRDGVERYLPGYEGGRVKIVGAAGYVGNWDANLLRYTGFEPQEMNLAVVGITKNELKNKNVAKIEFEITKDVTRLPGFAGNAHNAGLTDASNPGGLGEIINRSADFSFDKREDKLKITATVDANGDINVAAEITHIDDKMFLKFYCKDFGGRANVQVRLLNAANKDIYEPASLRVPLDNDGDEGRGDGIADVWEESERGTWGAAFGPHAPGQGLTDIKPRDDSYEFRFMGGSPAAPDPAQGQPYVPPTAPQLADAVPDVWRKVQGLGQFAGQPGFVGDGLPAFYEYRGVWVSGGIAPDGTDPFAGTGRHIRLSVAQREVLVDTNLSLGTTRILTDLVSGVPAITTMRTIMNSLSRAYSQTDFGAGIRLYYVLNVASQPKHAPPERPRTFLAGFKKFVQLNYRGLAGGAVPIHFGFRHLMFLENPRGALDIRTSAGWNQQVGKFSGFSNGAKSAVPDRSGSFVFVGDAVSGGESIFTKLLIPRVTAGGVDPATISPTTFLTGVAIHELAHQLDFRNGHYPDADGNGNPGGNTASDFASVQFAYLQNPLPAAYLYQDYWGVKPVADNFQATTRFGQGLHDGFLRSTYLDLKGFLDNPYRQGDPNDLGWTPAIRATLGKMLYGEQEKSPGVEH